MSRFVLLVIFLEAALTSIGSQPTTTQVFRSDYVYNKKSDAFFKLHTEAVAHENANEVCVVEGAVLMLPSNPQDLVQAHGMLKQFPDIGDLVWVANDDQHHESAEEPAIIDFEPETESPMTPWAKPCDAMTRKGEVETAGCSQRLPFFCKVDAKKVIYDSQCDVYNSGNRYTKAQNVSSCYKLPAISFTWNQAFADCQAEGAHLIVLNSQAEHDHIHHLINEAPRVRGSTAWWFFFAGFRAEVPAAGSPRVFKTIFNQTLEEAGFSTWMPNEPNNWQNNENCGAIFKNDGNLNDISCTALHGFICEKEVGAASSFSFFLSN